MSDESLPPPDAVELQQAYDQAVAAVAAFAREHPDIDGSDESLSARWWELRAAEQTAVVALHAHPWRAPGVPDRLKRIETLRAIARGGA
ncbi:hypothetical protein ACU686_12955 [Yinghuangia aomiensis]